MNIPASELKDRGYRFFEKMSHEKLVAFITPYLNKFNVSTFLFLIINVTFFAGFLFLLIKSIHTDTVGYVMLFFIAGWLMAYSLIPLHEFIHGLAYRVNGAKNVSYDINWRKFLFLTVADKFVTSKTEFFIIALAPFIVITSLISPFLLLVNANWQMFILGILLTHTICCIGDFGLVSYFLSHKEKTLVTYDDKDLKETFFYEKGSE